MIDPNTIAFLYKCLNPNENFRKKGAKHPTISASMQMYQAQ